MDGGSISINQRTNNNINQQQNQNATENLIEEDQNFRQNIEKNTLEQIFQQEIDEDDQDLYEDESGQLLKGIDPIERVDSYEASPGLGNQKRNAKLVYNNRFNMQKIQLSSPPQTDLKNMSEISITSSKKMKTPKMTKQIPIPNYALPTVETFIKDIRNKQLSQNSLIVQDENEQKKSNPMVHYQKSNFSPRSIKNQLTKGGEKVKNKYYMEQSKSKEGSSLKKPKKESRIKNAQSQKANLELKKLKGTMVNSKGDDDQDINMTQDDIFAKYAVTSNSNKSQININTIKTPLNQNLQFLSSREGEAIQTGAFKQSDKQTVIQTLGLQSELGVEHSNSIFQNQQSNQTQTRAAQGLAKRQKVKINSSKENSISKTNLFNETQNVQSNVARVNVQRQQNHMISFRLGDNQDNDEQQLVSIQLENNLMMKRQKVSQNNENNDSILPYEFQNEMKQNNQQAFPKSKHTLRMRDQKEYVIMALNNHSRKNFEENENVTMFVGSVDNKNKVDFKLRQEKLLKRREEQQRIRDLQFVEKQKLLEIMRQNKQILNQSDKRGSFDYYEDKTPTTKVIKKTKDKSQNNEKIINDSIKLLYPMNITAVGQIKDQEKIQQKLTEKSKIEDEIESDPEKEDDRKNKKIKLSQFKSDIFNQTPKIYNMNINLRDMDARTSIEHYEYIKKDMIQKQINKLIAANMTEEMKKQQKQRQSHSPQLRNHNLHQKNTTLKFFTKRNNSGNIEAAYSQTTLILSGNNTPLPYMNRRKEKFLKQINQEQDELLEQLQFKKRMLDFKQLKPNKLYHSFVTNMQTLDMPDENRFKQLQDTIHQASQKFFAQKMRPMHSTYSFDSWRSIIEKKIDLGFSCKSDSKIKFPKKFGLEIGKFGFKKARKHYSAQKFNRNIKSLDELDETKGSLSVKNKFDQDKEIIFPQFDKHISAQKQNILRMRWHMNQQANQQSNYETNAEVLFSENTGQTQQEMQAQDMRSKLLQKVRQHLKQKVKGKIHDKSKPQKQENRVMEDQNQIYQDEDSIDELEEKSVKKYNLDMGFQILKPSQLVLKRLKSLRESIKSRASSPKKYLDNQNNLQIKLQEIETFENEYQETSQNQTQQIQFQNGKQTSIKSTLFNTNYVEKDVTQASENRQNLSDVKTKIVQSNIYSDDFNSIDNKSNYKKQGLNGVNEGEEYYPKQESDSQIQDNLFITQKQPFQTINQSFNAQTPDQFSNPSIKFATNNTLIFNKNKIVKLSKQLSKKDQLNQIQQIFREQQMNPQENNYEQNLASLEDLNSSQQDQNNLDLAQRQRLMINLKKPKTAGAARMKNDNQINRITSDSSYPKAEIQANSNLAVQNQYGSRIQQEIYEDGEFQQEKDQVFSNNIQQDSQIQIWDISKDDQWNHSKSRKEFKLLNRFESMAKNQAASIKMNLNYRYFTHFYSYFSLIYNYSIFYILKKQLYD